jgi:hypothetical protein
MQTFLPYADIGLSIWCLDWKRLGKQRVEALQILKANNQGQKIAFIWGWNEAGKEYKKLLWFKPLDSGDGIKSTPWYNHPCTKMWRGYEDCLTYYYNECIYLWKQKHTNNMPMCLYSNVWGNFPRWDLIAAKEKIFYPPWFGNKEFHDSHKSNLLRKMPEHYSKFNWQVPNDLPYIWPVN